MLSNLTLDQALKSARQIEWKHIFLVTICLMLIHFILFQETTIEAQSPSPPAAAITKPPPKPETERPQSKAKPKQPPPLVHNLEEEKPQIEIAPPPPLNSTDGNIETPYDAIPVSEPIAICIAVKDQPVELVEFFTHHYNHMGIKRFYVMDDGSDPPLSQFQYPGIPRAALTFTYQERETREEAMQTVFYTWCIERYRERHTWIAFLDGDEFLSTPGQETLSEFLRTFENDDTVGAVGVNWRMHTSSGHLYPQASVRKAYTTCIYDDLSHSGLSSPNAHIKSIVKTSHAGPPMNPHKFATSEGSYTVGENGDHIDAYAWRRPITRSRIGVHHYAVKSREEYEQKMMRGNGMSDPKGEEFWEEMENGLPHVNCSEMAAYEP